MWKVYEMLKSGNFDIELIKKIPPQEIKEALIEFALSKNK